MRFVSMLGVAVSAMIATVALWAETASEFGSSNHTSSEAEFNLVFKYGVRAKNELNTFEGTYTKDMVFGPPITVKLSLSREELERIYQKMLDIEFFDYPERFSAPPGEVTGLVQPHASYYFKVVHNSTTKELSWENGSITKNEKAGKLGELASLIITIIESRGEYQQLPPSRGGYQ